MKETIRILGENQKMYAKGAVECVPYEPVHEVIIREYHKDRTLAQNRLYWMWMTEISDGYEDSGGERHSPEVWSEFFKRLFLGIETLKVRNIILNPIKSTTSLNTREFTAYLERIDHYCNTQLRISLTHPDIYAEAMQ